MLDLAGAAMALTLAVIPRRTRGPQAGSGVAVEVPGVVVEVPVLAVVSAEWVSGSNRWSGSG